MKREKQEEKGPIQQKENKRQKTVRQLIIFFQRIATTNIKSRKSFYIMIPRDMKGKAT